METNSIDELKTQLKHVQLQVRFLSVILVLGLALAVTSGILGRDSSSSILRARGLVIVDAQGHERILIGAPIPAAANRVRTDLKRAAQIWGPQMGGAGYIANYKAYQNGMNGILILDNEGFDRVAIGNPVPDPNIGKRIAPTTGIAINDDKGFERTGYGVMKVDGQYRDVLGMDSRGRETVDLAVFDGGDSGLFVSSGDRELLVGNSQPPPGESKPFQGLLVEHGKEVLYKSGLAEPQRAEIHVPADILARYVGTYQFTPTLSITIRRDGAHLFGQASGASEFEMFPESQTDFFLKAGDAQFTFVTNGSGRHARNRHPRIAGVRQATRVRVDDHAVWRRGFPLEASAVYTRTGRASAR
jgi:Domain of unknown function (DUF3471)